MLSPEVAAAITGWRSRSCSEAIEDFARAVVVACVPERPARARALLFASSRLGAFCTATGLELDPATCLHASVIERFVVVGTTGLGEATRRTLRSNLRFLARTAVAHPPAPVTLARERAKAPYAAAEIASYLALADAQPTVCRRMRATALVSLGAGAGLIGTELRRVRGADVVRRSGGVLVTVSGRRPRAVPVLADYHERLLDAAAFFEERYLVTGGNPNSHNVTTPLISSLSGGVDLPRLEVGRLRSTYLVALAEAIGLRAFMDAAGITCTQRLGDLVALAEAVGEAEAVALLGATS